MSIVLRNNSTFGLRTTNHFYRSYAPPKHKADTYGICFFEIEDKTILLEMVQHTH